MQTHLEEATVPIGPDEVGDLSAGQTEAVPQPNSAGACSEPPASDPLTPAGQPSHLDPAPGWPLTEPSSACESEPIFAATPLPDFDLAKALSEPEWMPASDDLTPAEIQALELRRIHEYQIKSLGASNPLKAVMGSANAGMMRLNISFQQGLEMAARNGPMTPERFEKFAKMFDFQMRMTRQIVRFAQPEMRPRRVAKPPRPVAPPAPRQLPK